MKISAAGRALNDADAYTAIYDTLVSELEAKPSLLIVHCSASTDLERLMTGIYEYSGNTPLFGGTSCMGVMTHMGVHMGANGGVGMLGISDGEGSFGVGASDIGDDPQQAAANAVLSALEHAGRPGEVPAFVLLSSCNGHEEELLAGIASVVGRDVPIAGGTSADDNIGQKWRQFANGIVFENAVVVAVLFPSTEVMFAFHSGYQPTSVSGRVTKAEKRLLCEIDGRPAALVYNEWIGGLISDQIKTGGCIMPQTTFHPLGRIVGYVGAIPYYKLTHPSEAKPDGTMKVFTDVAAGDELVVMNGTADSLVSRAGRVAMSAMEAYSVTPAEVGGALIMYCAGCMFGIRERLGEVVEGLKSVLPEIPFLVTFSFGEQGCFLGGENRHGNLMISVLLFAKTSSSI